jgi:hypothetical protein
MRFEETTLPVINPYPTPAIKKLLLLKKKGKYLLLAQK